MASLLYLKISTVSTTRVLPQADDKIIVHPSESHGLLRIFEQYNPGKLPSSAHITTGTYSGH